MNKSLLIILALLQCLTSVATGSFVSANDNNKKTKITVLMSTPLNMDGIFKPVATLICPNDTLYADSGQGSIMQVFSNVPAGKIIIEATCKGLASVTDTIEVKEGDELVHNIVFRERCLELEMITVKGNIPAMVYRNDTIQFNPDGVYLEKDDRLRQMLERMPGIKITEGGIEFNGQQIAKTYVDGRTLFGNITTTALDHVMAGEVAHVLLYKEDEHPDEKKANRKGKKQLVMEVKTKHGIVDSRDGVLAGGIGRTLGNNLLSKHDWRHIAAADFSLFSDDWLMQFDGMQNNVNISNTNPYRVINLGFDASPTYSENTLAKGKVSRRWLGVREYNKELGVDYAFSRKAPENHTSKQQDYIATDDFLSRLYNQNTTSNSVSRNHNIGLEYTTKRTAIGDFTLSARFKSDYSNNSSITETTDRVVSHDDTTTEKANRLLNNNEQKDKDASAAARWNFYAGDIDFSLSTSFNHKETEGNEYRNDAADGHTFAETDIATSQQSNALSVDATIAWKNPDVANSAPFIAAAGIRQSGVYLDYSFNTMGNKQNSKAQDMLLGDIDEANTYAYNTHTNSHLFALSFIPNWKKMGASMRVGMKNVHIADYDCLVPSDTKTQTFSHYYNVPEMSFTLDSHQGLSFGYTMSSSIPNISQLRPQIDNSNPYWMTSGNPDLKAGNRHEFSLKYGMIKGTVNPDMLTLALSFSMADNMVANRTTYFTHDTYLPSLHTMAYAGSTLQSYGNINGMKTLQALVYYMKKVPALRLGTNWQVNYTFSKTPFYYNEVRDMSNIHNLNIDFTIKPMNTKTFHYSLTLGTKYQHRENVVNKVESSLLINNLNATFEKNNIFKIFTFEMHYDLIDQHHYALSQHTIDHILKANLKCKPASNLTLSLLAYDLLNRSNNAKWTITDNYTSVSRSENFGRYIILNCQYSFRKVKANRFVRNNFIDY